MQERVDVVVIGAGLGGLLTAAILARRGLRVLVLEREPRPGGRLRSYDVEGCVVDAGAYLWPNRHLGAALAAAGATDFVAARIPLAQVLRVFVQGDGGRPHPFPWPGRPQTPELVAAARAVLGIDAPTFRRLAGLWERLAALSDAEVAALRHVPVAEALPRFAADAALRSAFRRNVMIFGTCEPDAASMAECIGLRRRPPGSPAWPECPGANPAGGIRALPLALARALSAAGGTLRCGWTVEQIAVEEGRAVGVLAHGPGAPFTARFAAAAVVCNVPIWRLPDLLPLPQLAPELAAAAAACAAVGGVVAAAFAFDGLPRRRADGAADAFPGWTRLLTGPGAGFGGGMTWATLHSPRNAPAGIHVLQAMRLTAHAELADAARVAAIHADFRAMLDEIYLDAAARLRWARQWITRDGSDYLIHAGPRPPVAAPGIADLYFVGETTDVPAVQMDAAALSALTASERIAAARWSDAAP